MKWTLEFPSICTHVYQLYFNLPSILFPPFLTAFFFSFEALPSLSISLFSQFPSFAQLSYNQLSSYPLPSFLRPGCLTIACLFYFSYCRPSYSIHSYFSFESCMIIPSFSLANASILLSSSCLLLPGCLALPVFFLLPSSRLPACLPSFSQGAFQFSLPSKLEQAATSSDCFFLPSA